MYNAFLQRTQETISALVRHIHTSDKFRTAVFDNSLKCVAITPCFDPSFSTTETAPDRLEWRIIDHCAAVTRIYAIYEQFSHEMIREHLNLLQSKISFSRLPASIQASYRLGIAKILEKKEGPRFGDLNLGQLISGYNNALSGKEYEIEPKAMLIQEQNLRLPELERVMSACGIHGVAAWIEQHRAVKAFFESGGRLTASAASEMAELIKYRNDAAHGSIDISDILHLNILVEFCEFIAVVCEALSERVQLVGLQSLEAHDHVRVNGKVTELLKEGAVSIGEMTGVFQVGSIVYLCGDSYCLERRVASLQLEGVSHDKVELSIATELGMMFDAPGKKNALVMTFEYTEATLATESGSSDAQPDGSTAS